VDDGGHSTLQTAEFFKSLDVSGHQRTTYPQTLNQRIQREDYWGPYPCLCEPDDMVLQHQFEGGQTLLTIQGEDPRVLLPVLTHDIFPLRRGDDRLYRDRWQRGNVSCGRWCTVPSSLVVALH
jgi:hypothetical protein